MQEGLRMQKARHCVPSLSIVSVDDLSPRFLVAQHKISLPALAEASVNDPGVLAARGQSSQGSQQIGVVSEKSLLLHLLTTKLQSGESPVSFDRLPVLLEYRQALCTQPVHLFDGFAVASEYGLKSCGSGGIIANNIGKTRDLLKTIIQFHATPLPIRHPISV